MITTAAHARERVRLILDRANSPWLTNTEINGFLEMAINEYTRERVGMFGANQKIRDDFGGFVKSAIYSNTFSSADEQPGTDVIRRQFSQFNTEGVPVPSAFLPFIIPGGEYANDGNGVACSIKDNEDDVDTLTDSINFAVKNDPFNSPNANAGEYQAVRVNDYYYIRPANTSKFVIITYVSNNNNVENIVNLPAHGREEVCQIASRKIMGTVADERYSTGEREIKQLEGK